MVDLDVLGNTERRGLGSGVSFGSWSHGAIGNLGLGISGLVPPGLGSSCSDLDALNLFHVWSRDIRRNWLRVPFFLSVSFPLWSCGGTWQALCVLLSQNKTPGAVPPIVTCHLLEFLMT